MRKYLTTYLGGVLLAGGAATVHADLVITASEAGFPTTTVLDVSGAPATDPSGGTSVTYGDFKINILGAEADESAPTELLSSSTKIQNIQHSTPGTHTLTLTVSAVGYTLPVTPPALTFDSNIGGTVTTGSPVNLLAFQGYVDPTNTPQTAGAFTPGPQSAVITASNGSYNSDASTVIGTLGAPYAILGTISFTLGANSQVNYSSSETLTPVPEPASLAVLSLAGVGLLARRRRA